MESSGKIGKVNISASTYQLVKEFFDCEFRGKMPVKYKGDIATYFVDGIKSDLSEEDGLTPNSKFLTQIQLLRLLDLEEYIIEGSIFNLKSWKKGQTFQPGMPLETKSKTQKNQNR